MPPALLEPGLLILPLQDVDSQVQWIAGPAGGIVNNNVVCTIGVGVYAVYVRVYGVIHTCQLKCRV